MSHKEALRGAGYAAVLLWVNAYVCRTWFFHPTAWMNSLHGYWAAIARLADGWLFPSWWPFWDLGIPFEYTSAPLVPAMTAAIAASRKVPPLMAVQAVSTIFYCAAPLSLFFMAWMLTRAPGYSFFAGLFYSLLSPAKILAPDGEFSWANVLNPHRFMLQALWDETPRVAALTFLLLFIFFLTRSMERRGNLYPTAAAAMLGLAMLASPFAAPSAAIAALCLLTVLRPADWRRNLVCFAAVSLFAYALAARFLPPSLWIAMAAASAAHEAWNPGAITAFAGIILAWLILVHFLERRSKDWRLPFFALLAYAMSCAPILDKWLDRRILPQPQRFRIEMEPAIALLVVFGVRPWLERWPRWSQAVLALMILVLSGVQVVHVRRLAKDALYPADVTRTIEYRTAQRVARELPGARVMLPGSIARWANTFTGVQQFSGSEGTMAYSQVQQRAMTAVYNGDASISLARLKAYGAAAVVVSGEGSREQFHPFSQPEKFRGLLPELWSEEGVTVYRVPQRTLSLAHVIPETAVVSDTAQLDRYNAAVDDASLPEAAFEWQGRNRIRIRAVTAAGQVISIQVSHHPGWSAMVNGRPAAVHRDGLGMMWVRPHQVGPATVEIRYDGGWELRICSWLSLSAVLAACFLLVRGSIR